MWTVRLDLPSTIESVHLLDALISEMLNLMQIDEQIYPMRRVRLDQFAITVSASSMLRKPDLVL